MMMPAEVLAQLALTYGYCAGSAVLPLLNAEAFLLALGTQTSRSLIWSLALAAAAGQMSGKLVFYAIGRGVRSAAWLQRKAEAKGPWLVRMQRCEGWARRHAWGPATVTLVSAASGLPPLALWSVLAGSLNTRWWVFLTCGLTGRYLRFVTLLGATSVAGELLARG